MKTKIVSLLLVLTMVIGMIPFTASATDAEMVYVSVSQEGEYASDKNGEPIANRAVPLSELAAIDLTEYFTYDWDGTQRPMAEYLYDADGDGVYEITALHLCIYVHETICGLQWEGVSFSGAPGSTYFAAGLFGFESENLRYNMNGIFPIDEKLSEENGYSTGATSDRIVLKAGDFLDVANYTCWGFYSDPMTGFRYFADSNGDITRTYTAEVGQAVPVALIRSHADVNSGTGTGFSPEAGTEIYYGTAYGTADGTVIADENGTVSVTFSAPGTYYVWSVGGHGTDGMGFHDSCEYYWNNGVPCFVSTPACATVTVTEPAPEPADPINVKVTLADKGQIVMAKKTVTVTDRDASGDFAVDEVLYAAHEAGYAGGADAGYGCAVGDYGLYITKLWGDTSGNYGYWRNDASCWSLADTVSEGDEVVAFVYQDTTVWDSYAKFAQDSYTALSEAAVTVTLQKAGYDANWNTVFSNHAGATLKVCDSAFQELPADAYSVVDNGDGTYAVKIMTVGEYWIAAYDNTTPIVPALCAVTVTMNPDLVYADAVEALIAAIEEVDLNKEEQIKAARAAYELLSDARKALVSNYAVLTAAEEKLEQLKKEAEQAATDQGAADAVEEIISAIGKVNVFSGNKISNARSALDALNETQKALVENMDVLIAAENALKQLYAQAAMADHKTIFEATGKYIAGLGTPSVGSTGGEWMVIDLVRAGYPCPEGYYENVVKFIRLNINEKEQLHNAKGTENSRVILALTAAGYDVTNVDGHNLLMGLTDMLYVKKQGINGPIWALIAFDSHDYRIPANPNATEQVTREKLIAYILEKQLSDGGWALSGTVADADMTGMAIQALAPYYDSNAEVKAAVDAALNCLSAKQNAAGSFGSIDGNSVESCAQVVVALTALGIDPETDPRFVKNGISALDGLCLYATEGGGFAHVPNGERNGMATEQGQYALVAYFRFVNGQTALYDMSDVVLSDDGNPETGDKAQVMQIGLIMLISLCGMAVLLPKKKTF